MNTTLSRFALAMLVAVVTTLTLFIVMSQMTSVHDDVPAMARSPYTVDFVRLIKETKTQSKPLEEQEPEPPRKPPLPMPKVDMDLTSSPPMATPQLNVPLPSNVAGLAGLPMSAFLPSVPQTAAQSDIIPLVQVPPMYPMRAKRLGLTGHVVVEFTIDEQGGVVDPKVVEADPLSLFDAAAIQAIKNWKFKAKLEDGKAVSRRARQRFDFSLNN